jgi:hypothetical protein
VADAFIPPQPSTQITHMSQRDDHQKLSTFTRVAMSNRPTAQRKYTHCSRSSSAIDWLLS